MRKLLLFQLLLLLFQACSDDAASLRLRLETLDKEFGGAYVVDPKKAQEFISTAEKLALLVQKSNPDEYVDLMLKTAGLAKSIESYDKSLELYTKLTETTPGHSKVSIAFFMIGYIYANHLKDLEKGKAGLELFLQKYPNDGMANSAREEIKNLGKTPEQIMDEIRRNNPDSSNAVQ